MCLLFGYGFAGFIDSMQSILQDTFGVADQFVGKKQHIQCILFKKSTKMFFFNVISIY